MWLPSGFGGFILSIAVPTLLWGFFYSERKKISAYNLDPQGKAGSFEPMVRKYLHLAEFMIGLPATPCS